MKKLTIGIILFAFYVLALGFFQLSSSFVITDIYGIKEKAYRETHSLAMSEIGKMTDSFEELAISKQPGIKKSFYADLDEYKTGIRAFEDIQNKSRKVSLISFAIALSSGIYYLFAGIGLFRLAPWTKTKLIRGIRFFLFNLFVLWPVEFYLISLSLNRLFLPVNVLNAYFTDEPFMRFSYSDFPPIFWFTILGFALLNIFLYVGLPLWLINRPKIKEKLLPSEN